MEKRATRLEKGTTLSNVAGGTYWFVAGRWGGDVVLAAILNEDDEVLVYGEGELYGLIEDGTFKVI